MSRFYGDAVANSFGLKRVANLTSRMFGTPVSVSRLSIGADRIGMSPRIPAEDTFILALYLTDLRHHELWRSGRRWIAQGYAANTMRIVNLSGEMSALIAAPHRSMSFYLPRAALNEFSDSEDMPRIGDLSCLPGTRDAVVQHIAALLQAAMDDGQASSLFVDHLLLALCAHLTGTYGGAPRRTPALSLNRTKIMQAKSFMADHCADDVRLCDVAQHCGLSRSQFARSFRLTTGMTPHRWLQRHRIDQAKAMLGATGLPIAEVAVRCGFADQSHLTRVFTRLAGASPAAWRRRHRRS